MVPTRDGPWVDLVFCFFVDVVVVCVFLLNFLPFFCDLMIVGRLQPFFFYSNTISSVCFWPPFRPFFFCLFAGLAVGVASLCDSWRRREQGRPLLLHLLCFCFEFIFLFSSLFSLHLLLLPTCGGPIHSFFLLLFFLGTYRTRAFPNESKKILILNKTLNAPNKSHRQRSET